MDDVLIEVSDTQLRMADKPAASPRPSAYANTPVQHWVWAALESYGFHVY